MGNKMSVSSLKDSKGDEDGMEKVSGCSGVPMAKDGGWGGSEGQWATGSDVEDGDNMFVFKKIYYSFICRYTMNQKKKYIETMTFS